MNVPLVIRYLSLAVCMLVATWGVAQDLPTIPPSVDPIFWGKSNAPYILKLTQTTTSPDGSHEPQKHVSEMNVCRDAAGRVRTESFYDNGRLMNVFIRDPGKNTMTLMKVVEKSVYVTPMPRPAMTLPGKGWTIEQLPPRVIAGFSAEGLRYTRTIPAPPDGTGSPDTVIDEEWISEALGLVLEQTTVSQRDGTITKIVSDLRQVEPDPTLFTVPSTYSMEQAGPPAH